MTINELESSWTKYNSLVFLKQRMFNTPNFRLITLLGELIQIKDQVKSIRIFNDNPKSSMLLPHFPNRLVDNEVFNACYNELSKGNKLIVSDPIDPRHSLYKGNIMVTDFGDFVVEYTEGPGTVRDLEKSVVKRAITLQELSLIGPYRHSLVSKSLSTYWGIPIILEWSIYDSPVGLKNQELIFWEIRKG